MKTAKQDDKQQDTRLLKRVIGIALSLVVLFFLLTLIWIGFILGWGEIPHIFVAFHLICLMYIIFFLGFFILISKLIWFLLSPSTKRIFRGHKKKFYAITLLCSLFFFVGSWVANHFVFDYNYNILSMLGNFGIFIFFVCSILTLLRPSGPKKWMLYFSGSVWIASLLLSLVKVNIHGQVNPPSKDALTSLPYANWVPAEKTIKKQGVTQYNQEKAFKGMNIFISRNFSTVYLMDMIGNILHTWSANLNDEERYEWNHAELMENGDILEIARRKMLIRLDWDSNIKWIKKIPVHHDLDTDKKEEIYIPTHKFEILFHLAFPIPFENNYLAILSPEGRIKREISFHKMLKDQIPSKRYSDIVWWLINPKNFMMRLGRIIFLPEKIFDSATDIFHVNTIEIISKDLNAVFKKGNVLFCSRYLDLIGVIDVKKEKLLWSWGKNDLEGPHHPMLLENGNILIFDNGIRRKYSRILEINPLTEKIVWQFVADPPQSFFSNWGGASQRLPNGNTLITESNKGRVFEITHNGEVVWEFYNPEIITEEKKRAPIYRMMRISETENYKVLKRILTDD